MVMPAYSTCSCGGGRTIRATIAVIAARRRASIGGTGHCWIVVYAYHRRQRGTARRRTRFLHAQGQGREAAAPHLRRRRRRRRGDRGLAIVQVAVVQRGVG